MEIEKHIKKLVNPLKDEDALLELLKLKLTKKELKLLKAWAEGTDIKEVQAQLHLDEERYARVNPCSGYIIGNFSPSPEDQGTGPFRAVIGVSAELEVTGKQRDARERNMQTLVITGSHLDIQDLMVELESGQKAAVRVSNLERHLKLTQPALFTKRLLRPRI